MIDPEMSVLVVDDASAMRRIVRGILKELGFKNIREAQNGQAALDELRKNKADFVVSDWNMPVMSGIEFLRVLGETDLPHRPKIVFCTTENGIGHIRAAIDAGADEYVMKPFDRETLESKLQIVGVA